jgi:transposase-like protein
MKPSSAARLATCNKSTRLRRGLKGRGTVGKTIVLGILEREGKVRATIIPDRSVPTIRENVRPHVEDGSEIFSDEHGTFWHMDLYTHKIVNHLEQYVDGNIHTNGLENFWSLLKRSIGGSYVSVEPFHLFRYVDEQAFRYNNRKDMNDSDRFDLAVPQIVGKRLTWAEVTGQVTEIQAPPVN